MQGDKIPDLTDDEKGRLQFAQKLIAHQTHEMSGYLSDKQDNAKLYQKLRGKLVAKMLHTRQTHKCCLIDTYLNRFFRREIVDVSLDVSSPSFCCHWLCRPKSRQSITIPLINCRTTGTEPTPC